MLVGKAATEMDVVFAGVYRHDRLHEFRWGRSFLASCWAHGRVTNP